MYIAVCDDQTEELKDLTELIGGYIVKPPGKPTVVPAADKRRPYAKKKLEEMFGGKIS